MSEELVVSPGTIFPDRIYKFLSKNTVDFWCEEETVMMSSNYYFANEYQNMETKNDFINDPWEGFNVWRQDGTVNIYEDSTQEERDSVNQVARYFGFEVAPGSAATFRNNVVQVETGQFHMLCFSIDASNETRRQFCTEDFGMSPPYDACLSISNVRDFFSIILLGGKILHEGKEIPLRDVYLGLEARAVKYNQKVASWPDPIPESSAFQKDAKFSDQREFRVVFIRYPGKELEMYPDRMLINASGIGQFFDRLF